MDYQLNTTCGNNEGIAYNILYAIKRGIKWGFRKSYNGKRRKKLQYKRKLK